MELTAPEKTGLIVTSITGLGPVKAEIKCTSIATSDGSIFNSARLGERNIVLKLQFLPNPTIEETITHIQILPNQKESEVTDRNR